MVGLHIRLDKSLTEVLDKAERFKVPIFQTFLINSQGRRVKLEKDQVQEFLERKKNFEQIYLHASYWVNLASVQPHGMYALERELDLANELQLNTLILHPGSAVGFNTKMHGIDEFSTRINKILNKNDDLVIILENTTHAKNCIGSDIIDFREILSRIERPEKIKFCLDTAHAYGYGYDIANEDDQDRFIELVDQTIGLDSVQLIHLNDTVEALASKLDRHAIPGQGNIGPIALKRFVTHERLNTVPIILELPVVTDQEEKNILEQVCNWRKNI